MRTAARVRALLVCAALVPASCAHAQGEGFRAWLEGLWPQAQALGVSRAVFAESTRGLEPDFSLPDLDLPGRPARPAGEQAEFVLTPADYLKETALERLAAHGRALADKHRAALSRIEREYGVPGEILLAIFGRETDYGRYRLTHDALRVLATQGYAGRRRDLFRDEFLMALKLIEDGMAQRADLKSSWSGALGLMQFLPSELHRHAADFDGDGRADPFRSVPDALAAAARKLAGHGWQRGQAWAYEVRVPATFDCTLGVPEAARAMRAWFDAGVTPVRERKPGAAELAAVASILQPEGAGGPAFLTPKNYFVLKDYNFSDLYVLFVGQLSDRIAGRGGFRTPWTKSRQMRAADVAEMQRTLAARGFYRDRIDGKAGMLTRAALGAYQKKHGLALDCWPGAAVLGHMRALPR